MDNLFSGLDKLGLDPDEFNNIYAMEDSTSVKRERAKVEEKKEPMYKEEDVIYDKSISCPLCGKDFKTKVVKTGKVRHISTDTDLKPVYAGIEPLKYDIIACPHCGYAATSKFFGHLTSGQTKMIRESICANFKGMASAEGVYTYGVALERYKLALANVIAMKGKISERAYLCLKMGWLYRSKRLTITEDDANAAEKIAEYKDAEKSFIKSAYEGFTVSYTKELPPICGMDINTLAYLLADLALKCGDYDNCSKYISTVLTSSGSNSRLKERARELKELWKSETGK